MIYRLHRLLNLTQIGHLLVTDAQVHVSTFGNSSDLSLRTALIVFQENQGRLTILQKYDCNQC